MRPRTRTSLAAALMLFPLICSTEAAVYRVGPGQKYSKVSQVAERLRAGDVVEITGDISDSAIISASGTPDKPLTIRGVTSIENGRILRPQVTPASATCPFTLKVSADWVVLEGLGFTGFMGQEITKAAVVMAGGNVVIRNCHFHHNLRSLATDCDVARELLVEFCEFESDGYGSLGPTTLYSKVPGAMATVQHCYFHSNVGNHLLRIGYPRNVIRYNWFEDQCHFAVQITTPALFGEKDDPALADKLLPAHSDIVGNVFASGWGSNTYGALQIGGSSPESPGTEGDFNIAHNLFLGRRGGEVAFIPIATHGNVDRINVFNNVFLDCRYGGCKVYERDQQWDTPRSQVFASKRGIGEPTVEGSNNWISESAYGVPTSFSNTLSGLTPGFWSLVDLDFRPLKVSLLAGKGLWPLPDGKIVGLVPEYEPQRGIPLDLKPRVRRKVEKPSIGPFEAVEEDPAFVDDSEELVLGVKDVRTDVQWQLNFGKARRMALEYLSQGDPGKALQCAKMQFILSPMDERTINLAIESVRQMLVAVDGNDERAEVFEEYARYGAAGRDGQAGTNDDLADPITDVTLDLFTRPREFYEDFDKMMQARAAACVKGLYYAYWWETQSYETEMALVRIEGAEFEEAFNMLFPQAVGAVKRPPFQSGDRRALRNQVLIDRVSEGLSAILRSRTDSVVSTLGAVRNHLDYALYGPPGMDGISGTIDDIDIVSPADGRTIALESSCSGEISLLMQSVTSARQIVPSLQDRIAIILETQARAIHRLNVIAELSAAGQKRVLLGICPSPREVFEYGRDRTEASRAGMSGPTGEDVGARDSYLADVRRLSLAVVMEAYNSVLAKAPDTESAGLARMYLSAYVLGVTTEPEYADAISLLMEGTRAQELPTFIVVDALGVLREPFVAGSVYDALERVAASRMSDHVRSQLTESLEKTQRSSIESADERIKDLGLKDAGQEYAEAISQCDNYLERFRSGVHASEVELLKLFYWLRARRYDVVIHEADGFVNRYRGSSLVPNALYLKGVAAFESGQLSVASESLAAATEEFPYSDIAAKALLTLAKVYLSAQKEAKALDCFTRLVDFYPNDPSSLEARAIVEKSKGRRHD